MLQSAVSMLIIWGLYIRRTRILTLLKPYTLTLNLSPQNPKAHRFGRVKGPTHLKKAHCWGFRQSPEPARQLGFGLGFGVFWGFWSLVSFGLLDLVSLVFRV